MKLFNRYFWVIALCCLVGGSTALAQKSKKSGKKKSISEKTLREAEYLFTEGQKFFILEDYAKALVLYDKCLELNPNNAVVYFKIAEIQARNEAFDVAESNIEKAIAIDGNNKYFYLLAANIYSQTGQYEKASVTYETMFGKIVGVEQHYYELATIYIYQNRYDDAISAFDRAEKTLGINPEISYQKQKIYLQTNKLDAAIEEGKKLIAALPEETSHQLSLVNILAANGRETEANEALEALLKTDPNDGQAMLLMADIQKRDGDMEGYQQTVDKVFKNGNIGLNVKIQIIAESTYQIAQDRSSGNPNITLEEKTISRCSTLLDYNIEDAQVHALCGDLYYALQDQNEALNHYTGSLSKDKTNFQVWQNVLQIESELGENESLVAHADEALEYFPNQSVIYMYAGLAHLQLKSYDEAASMLEYGKKLSIQNQAQLAIFSSLLGSAYNGSKDYPKSDNAYRKALELNPQDQQTLNNFSYYLSLRKENLDEAEKMAKKVVAMDPNNSTYLDTYAWVLYMKKKYKAARIQIEKAIEVGEPSAINHEHYGDILYRLGKIDEAVAQWLKAKSLDDSLENIDTKIQTRSINE